MPITFPDVPLADLLLVDASLSQKLKDADAPDRGGNADAKVQWEEAAKVLDSEGLRRFVNATMNAVPNPLMRAGDLYHRKASWIIEGLKSAITNAKGYDTRVLYPSQLAEPWIMAAELARTLTSLLPSEHPAHKEARALSVWMDQSQPFEGDPVGAFTRLVDDYTRASSRLEGLAHFLPEASVSR